VTRLLSLLSSQRGYASRGSAKRASCNGTFTVYIGSSYYSRAALQPRRRRSRSLYNGVYSSRGYSAHFLQRPPPLLREKTTNSIITGSVECVIVLLRVSEMTLERTVLLAPAETFCRGPLCSISLRHYATNEKVAGSIPDEVIGLFLSPNPCNLMGALRSTEPLTEICTENRC
jgi:hypothetical protein